MARISGTFDTRREAEMTVEHLVQEHGVERTGIWIQPLSAENSAGIEVAGADAKRGDPAPAPDDEDAALNGRIEVSLDTGDLDSGTIRAVFEDFSAADIRID